MATTTPAPTAAPVTTPIPTRRHTVPRVTATTRVAYTGYATRGNKDDHIVDHSLKIFYKTMAWLGGIAILAWLLFGGYAWGSNSNAAPVTITQPMVSVAPPVQQTTPQPRWSSYADCQRGYVLTLRRDPEGACDNLPY